MLECTLGAAIVRNNEWVSWEAAEKRTKQKNYFYLHFALCGQGNIKRREWVEAKQGFEANKTIQHHHKSFGSAVCFWNV